MHRDGVDEPRMGCSGINPNIDAALRIDGWLPIEEAPLSISGWDSAERRWIVSEKEVELEGLTTWGTVTLARYFSEGDYVDRWKIRGGILVHLTHWRIPRHLLG